MINIMLMWAVGILFYVLCGILAYGILFAFLQREFPEFARYDLEEDKDIAKKAALAGPLGLLFVLLFYCGIKHGVMFREQKNENQLKADKTPVGGTIPAGGGSILIDFDPKDMKFS